MGSLNFVQAAFSAFSSLGSVIDRVAAVLGGEIRICGRWRSVLIQLTVNHGFCKGIKLMHILKRRRKDIRGGYQIRPCKIGLHRSQSEVFRQPESFGYLSLCAVWANRVRTRAKSSAVSTPAGGASARISTAIGWPCHNTRNCSRLSMCSKGDSASAA